MMLVQKAPSSHPFSSPFHARRAPIHVQPTPTPGLLSLSKPKPAVKQRDSSFKTPPPKTPKTPSDPFTVNSSPRRKSPPPAKVVSPPTTLTSQPSGKLARRRQVQPQTSPTPAYAKTAPSTPKPRRSPPPKTPRPTPQRALTIDSASAAHGRFPVCDDLTDVETNDEPEYTPPSTPVRRFAKVAAVTGGPRTAPLDRTINGFPFGGKTPSPAFGDKPAMPSFFPKLSVAGEVRTPSGRPARGHGRSPSYQILSSSSAADEDGVFHMSSDEETGSSGAITLGNFVRRPQLSVGRKGHRSTVSASGHRSTTSTSLPTTSAMHAAAHDAEELAAKKAGYFAGSVFQDSPSPEELPAPSF